MKSYNLPFDQFASGPLDKKQKMFLTVVQAIRKADAAKFASVWTSPDQMKGLGTTIITMVDDKPENWISQYRSVFDFDNLKVIAQVQSGSRTVFIWDSVTKNGSLRNAFYVGFRQEQPVAAERCEQRHSGRSNGAECFPSGANPA